MQSGPPIGHVKVELSDGVITMKIRQFIYNAIMWRPYFVFNIPVCKRMVRKDTKASADTIASFLTMIYHDITVVHPNSQKAIIREMWNVINVLQRFCAIWLAEFQSSISAIEMSDFMDQPEVRAITEFPITPEMGVDVVEKRIAHAGADLIRLINNGKLEHNCLKWFLLPNLLNANQVPQQLIAFGPRTDINDITVLYPVSSSAMSGLKNPVEMAVESLSAKKSSFYNHTAIEESQYWGRKMHLLTANISKFYPGDCGTTLTIAYTVTKKNHKQLVGKRILHEGQELILTDDNIEDFMDKTINMFSPTTCRYTDGVCEKCGGGMTPNLNTGTNIGILSAIEIVKRVSQMILSSKHLVKTVSMIYRLLGEANRWFDQINNEIFWNDNMVQQLKLNGHELDDIDIGVAVTDFGIHADLLNVRRDGAIAEQSYTSLETIWFRNRITGEVLAELPMWSEKQNPFFTTEALIYMRDNYDKIEFGTDMIWIPMSKRLSKIPIMRTMIVNDNMMEFVRTITGFLNKDLEKYCSISQALQDFTDKLYNKAPVNIIHAEIVLKAYLVKTAMNYSIPVVNDPLNVIFKSTSKIIRNRTVSGELGFEKVLSYLSDPATYIIPKSVGPFDIFFDIHTHKLTSTKPDLGCHAA